MEIDEFDLRSAYNELRQKYELPEFEKMIEDFDIEKAIEKESAFLIREIRRVVNEKILSYLHLFETLVNPSAPPIFVFSLLRNIPANEKNSIKEIYKTLSKTQVEIMKLDTIYNENTEVKFINETFNMWQELKPIIYKLIESFEESFESDDTSKDRSYFG